MTFHMHSTFSDGADSPEAMVQAAIKLGWKHLGFSDHAPFLEVPGNMAPSRYDTYFSTIKNLSAQMADQIQILCGLELEWHELGADYPSAYSTRLQASDDRLDYFIGSMHFLYAEERLWSIDGPIHMVKETLSNICSGKGRVLAERYYRGLETMVQELAPPILGHLDLLKKHEGSLHCLDQDADWYLRLVDRVLDVCQEKNTLVEVNTGGMARGYTKEPYPSWNILKRMYQRNMPIILNSDSHATHTINFAYEEITEGLLELGYKTQLVPTGKNTWQEMPLSKSKA